MWSLGHSGVERVEKADGIGVFDYERRPTRKIIILGVMWRILLVTCFHEEYQGWRNQTDYREIIDNLGNRWKGLMRQEEWHSSDWTGSTLGCELVCWQSTCSWTDIIGKRVDSYYKKLSHQVNYWRHIPAMSTFGERCLVQCDLQSMDILDLMFIRAMYVGRKDL